MTDEERVVTLLITPMQGQRTIDALRAAFPGYWAYANMSWIRTEGDAITHRASRVHSGGYDVNGEPFPGYKILVRRSIQ